MNTRFYGQDHHSWRGGVGKSSLTAYITYASILSQHIEVRRDSTNSYILQVRCSTCGKWFSPRRAAITRGIAKSNHYRFYCSPACQHKSMRKPKQIIIVSYGNKQLIKRDKESRVQRKRELRKLHREQTESRKLEEKWQRRRRRVELLRKKREFREKHPELIKKQLIAYSIQWQKDLRKGDPLKWRAKKLIVMSKQRAKEMGWDFDLDEEWCIELMKHPCKATGIEFDNGLEGTYKPMNPYAASIDRVDPSEGYLKSNCRLVIWAFNNAKGEYSDKTVYEILKVFVERFKAPR